MKKIKALFTNLRFGLIFKKKNIIKNKNNPKLGIQITL